MRQSAVMFHTNGLNFEGVVAQPDATSGSRPGVVICHPGPLNGGSMDNNVVVAVAMALVDQGFTTLRFNFRGVGNSQGKHSHGELEHQEALAALEFLKAWPGVDRGKLGLAGYSFGNSVILGSASLQLEPKAFCFISPSLRALENTPLLADQRPKFLITGDMDRLAPSPGFRPLLETFSRPPTCQFVEGADHFWVGREAEMARQVSQFFLEHLN
jgi:alpha/beta superfamily hydrolase